jgi:Mlc titration factor MtfA (ptsG expression regulator)
LKKNTVDHKITSTLFPQKTLMIYLIIPLIAACILYFLLFHNSRPHPITDQASWHEPLLKQVSFYQKLNEKEQQIFRQRMAAFLEETYVDSVGFKLEELDEILVAASAIIPVFKFKEWRYNNLTGVVIYPDNFNEDLEYKNKDPNHMIGGVVGTGRFENK